MSLVQENKEKIELLLEAIDTESEEIKELLENTLTIDLNATEEIIRLNSEMLLLEDIIFDIEDELLKQQDISTIRKYKEIPSEEWPFMNTNYKKILYNTKRKHKIAKLNFSVAKAELIIMRKAVDDFIKKLLKKSNPSKELMDLITPILENYSYEDTLNSLYVTKNFEKYKINDKGELYLDSL